MQAGTPSVHWTTYVQTAMLVLSTVGTFVYVWFTYHIMKWAVDQGKANVELGQLSAEDIRRRHAIVGAEVWDVVFENLMALTELWRVLKETQPSLLLSEVAKREEKLGEIEIAWEALLKCELPTTARGPLTFGLSLFRGALNWMRHCDKYRDDVDGFREGMASNLAFAIQTLVQVDEAECGSSPDGGFWREYRKLAEELDFSAWPYHSRMWSKLRENSETKNSEANESS